jgi:hypothetical protein
MINTQDYERYNKYSMKDRVSLLRATMLKFDLELRNAREFFDVYVKPNVFTVGNKQEFNLNANQLEYNLMELEKLLKGMEQTYGK